ncbi:MAG: tetratricopeptide repeat protein [Nitrospirae bacterium]|nr:tetratricopeptide repeat protein [Nitrospirota bacterium]
MAYAGQGHTEEAIREFQNALSINPDDAKAKKTYRIFIVFFTGNPKGAKV